MKERKIKGTMHYNEVPAEMTDKENQALDRAVDALIDDAGCEVAIVVGQKGDATICASGRRTLRYKEVNSDVLTHAFNSALEKEEKSCKHNEVMLETMRRSAIRIAKRKGDKHIEESIRDTKRDLFRQFIIEKFHKK